MKSFIIQQNKIQKLYKESKKTKNYSEKIKKSEINKKANSLNYTLPKILYESSWHNAMFSQEGNLIDSSFYLTQSSSTSLLGQRVPVNLHVDTYVDLDIPEAWIPHIKSSIIIKNYPDVNSEGLFVYSYWRYSSANYYEIYGDSTLIYKGASPGAKYFSNTDKDAGNFLDSLSSKWFYGTIEYTDDGDSYRINGYIDHVISYYDVEALAGHPGYYSYKIFEPHAIDSISSSSVTGTGSYTVVTAYEDAEGDPQTTTTTTKNSTRTVDLFDDRTKIYLNGTLYKNDDYQGGVQNYGVDFNGVLGGTATLSSFAFDWETREQWKLFYSDKREKRFMFSTSSFLLQNIPDVSDYESATLPYTTITVDVNPTDNYPEEYQYPIPTIFRGNKYEGWSKISDNRYRFSIRSGSMFSLSVPATTEGTPYETDYVDEDWINNGTSYERVANDRGKEMPRYIPNQDICLQVKLLISFDNNFEYRESRSYS